MYINSSYYVDGPEITGFNFDDYAGNNNVSADQFLMQNTWLKKENGSPIQYPIELAFESYRAQYGIDSPAAFNELQKLSPLISRSFILAFLGKEFNERYITGHVHKHFHPPTTNKNNVYELPHRRTITAVIPTKLVDPVTEQVCMQKFDYDFIGKTPIYNVYQDVNWQNKNLKISPNIERIDMPKPGQYLILDFISSHTLHWVENSHSTNNEFIFLVQDI
jgi:hypothetical protein